jgi:hypothetical protein
MSNEFMTTAQGALGGLGTGASLGSTVGPYGTVIGGVIGAVVGGLSGNKKAKQQEEALNQLAAIPNIDPNLTMFRDQLLREKRAVESGFSTDFQVARDIIGKSEAGGMSMAAELAQRNPALALMAMNQVSDGVDSAINKSLGTIGTRSMGYSQMLMDLLYKASQRSADVDIMKASYAMGISSKEMADFNANSNAGMMKLADSSVLGGVAGLFAAKPKTTAGDVSSFPGINDAQIALSPNDNIFGARTWEF